MADQKIGQLTHYYDKIKVAVINLEKGDLKVGDKIKLIDKSGSEFTQKITSMQIEHAEIDIAKAKDQFGLKVDKEPKTNTKVVKVG